MNVRPCVMGMAATVALHVAPVASHHAATEFDLDVVQRYEGVIREFVWANPHIRVTLETQTDSRFPQGHSVGRWEGDTLVVDTTNFTDIIYSAIANGSRKRLTERFTLSADGTHLDYRFRMEDPEYAVGQASGEIRFDYRPDLTLENLECDAETAQRFFREFE